MLVEYQMSEGPELITIGYRAASVSQIVFQGFDCLQLDENEWWMAVDLETACPDGDSPTWYPCLVAMAVYPIGMPLGMGAYLFSRRRALQTHGSMERQMLSFFVLVWPRKHDDAGIAMTLKKRIIMSMTCVTNVGYCKERAHVERERERVVLTSE